MIAVFLSYRRSDLDIASRVHTWLIQHGIPKEDIFFDQDPNVNQYGRDFPTSIREAVSEAKLMIVVIGPAWTTAKLPGLFRKPRIKEDNDWVRNEIALAIAAQKEILPVVIDKAPVPTTRELPSDLHPLCSINMPRLYRDLQHFEPGMRGIAQAVDRTFPGTYPNLLRDPEPKGPLMVNVPPEYDLFTGREDLLERLHATFNGGDSETRTRVALAISGLGGMGKTQAAVKYVYRNSHEYKTVLWANADTTDKLLNDFKTFAVALDVPEKDNLENPQRVVNGVKSWLSNRSGWLLVLDNADDLTVVEDFLPRPNSGHTLLTTRVSSTARIADPIPIEPMKNDEQQNDGARFLLLRAGILGPTARLEPPAEDWQYAREIVKELGGLPLAIEQAGAYIEQAGDSVELREARLSTYLNVYKTHRADLFKQGAPPNSKYPHSVATTWLVNIKEAGANPAAIELLRLGAFLDPDAIPEEMFAGGSPDLGPELGAISSDQYKMDQAFDTLSRYSLIRRSIVSAIKVLSIHRLVQAVIQDEMNEETQRGWAERAIRTVNHAFPNNVLGRETWPQCERYLPHALACSALMKEYGLASPEAVRLLNQAGTYLRAESRFKEAEPLLHQALTMREDISGRDDLKTAESLDSLARLYFDQYLYLKAGPLYERVLNIRQHDSNANPKELARSINWLGLTCWYIGNKSKESREHWYERADQLYRHALPISEELPGREGLKLTLNIRNNEALLRRSQGKYEDALAINRDVLDIREKEFGPEDLDVAQSLQNLGVTYYEMRDVSHYAQAEEYLNKALAIRKEAYPNGLHIQIARCLRYLGLVYAVQNKDGEAEARFRQAWMIWGKVLEERSQVIEFGQEYAAHLRKMKRDEEAAIIEAEVKDIQDAAFSQD